MERKNNPVWAGLGRAVLREVKKKTAFKLKYIYHAMYPYTSYDNSPFEVWRQFFFATGKNTFINLKETTKRNFNKTENRH